MSYESPLLALDEAELPLFFGVDVGGTNIKIGLLDDQGATLAFEQIATNEEDGPEQAIQRTCETCWRLVDAIGGDRTSVVRAGLGSPGPMCLERGLLLNPVNLPNWHNLKIKDSLAQALGLEVSFVNDANAAAYGEFWVGTGQQYNSMALFTLGTGVGGGLIVHGTLINGLNSFGSETGHIIVDSRPDARLCVWGGGRGHLEAYASASAVTARTSERILAGEKSTLSSILDAGKAITSKLVYEAALEGDGLSLEIIDETAFYLGVGVTSTIHAIDPGIVVLGGAMDFGGRDCKIGQRFLKGITDEFQRRTFPNVSVGTKIDFATLGGAAGHIGAAGIAHSDYHNQHDA
ncbi:MAG: ROK family protein [Planctomycetota bacterium]|nr:ROK family protein [Planctomycetota bacterium]